MTDDKERASLSDFLSYEGHSVTAFEKVSEYEKWSQKNDSDIILIEVSSINESSLVWLRNNRQIRNKGIVVVSNQTDPLIRITSRKAGADEFLLKPILHEELSAIISNLIYRLHSTEQNIWQLHTKEWTLLSPNNNPIRLTFSEKEILERLAKNAGQVITKDEIAIALGYQPDVYDFRRLEIIVRRLRNKVQQVTGTRLPLDTAHRKGYAFTSEITLC